MARRARSTIFSRSIQRTIKALTRSAVRAGAKAVKQALQPGKPAARQRTPAKSTLARPKVITAVKLSTNFTAGLAGAQRYRLFLPPGVRKAERLPLLVMLHGCTQTSEAFATSTRMNQLAATEGFAVLYPEQNQFANLQSCWNWHQTRSGKAQTEADAILATILQVCQRQSIDPGRIALAGLSAGASMAALLAVRHPARFCALAMHSGIAPGMAHSLTGALKAMRGHGVAAPLSALATGTHLPALLVIQGSADPLVAPANGLTVAQLWATREGAKPTRQRTVQRGARHPSTLTDYKTKGRLVATLCVIQGLGHAWSGGAASQAYSDPKGPDASRMIWAFAARQFAKAV
ncbi:alpha/beta hydrolase family esterase [Rhodoferax sp.]|uniref:extracellular catalytic domain type 1 short-chain-length polyhydroxyalkanoate depolymerase n=1 Tax=Rhodoferax sp. TaxID=50421 RepID=UPI003BB5B3D0|nr:PHB depolymerase family esterase [Rhodoferax sp.]